MAELSEAERYRKYVLPFLGVLETVATKGKSPGTTALQQEQLFQNREDREDNIKKMEREARRQALEEKLTMAQIGKIEDEKKSKPISKAEQDTIDFQTKFDAATPEEQIKMVKRQLAIKDPAKFLEINLKENAPPKLPPQPRPQKTPPLKGLSESETGKLSEIKAGLEQLRELKGLTPGGPVMGRLRTMNPWDAKAVAFDAQMKIAAQNVAKGLEAGKLSDQDILRYRGMLPNYNDPQDVFNAKLKNVENMLIRQHNTKLKDFQSRGFDIGGLNELQGDMPSLSIDPNEQSEFDAVLGGKK